MSNNQKLEPVMECLHAIYKSEMAGVHRYLHYSFMVMGHNRIPIQKWFRENSTESMDHAVTIGEKITSLGGHPPMLTGEVTENNAHDINSLLEESLKHETAALALYKQLVKLAGDDIALEEMARDFVRMETEHHDEVKKMLKKPV